MLEKTKKLPLPRKGPYNFPPHSPFCAQPAPLVPVSSVRAAWAQGCMLKRKLWIFVPCGSIRAAALPALVVGKPALLGQRHWAGLGDAQEQELPNPGDNPVWVTREGGI